MFTKLLMDIILTKSLDLSIGLILLSVLTKLA